MTIAITGANGMVGRQLLAALHAAGRPTRALVRRPAALPGPIALADLSDPASLRAGMAGCTTLIANAALGSGGGTLEALRAVNVTGLAHSIEAAAAVGIRRVVLISTVAVYLPTLGAPMTEDQPRYGTRRRPFAWTHLSTDWRYILTKSEGEDRALALAQAHGIALTILRPGPLFGPHDRRFTARVLRVQAQPLALIPTLRLPLLFAGDVATAALSALDRPQSIGRAYNLAGPPTSLWDTFGLLRRLEGRGPRRIPLPLPLGLAYDCTAAARDLGFAPRPAEDAWAAVLAARGPP